MIFIDNIDEEALAWLKFSAKRTDFYFGDFVDALLTHVRKKPMEVGTIYLELSRSWSLRLSATLPAEDKIIETVRILYDAGYKETADDICSRFAEEGFNFLRSLYEEYQDQL